MYTPQQKYTNNNDKQREGGIDSINTTFDFFPIVCHGILPYSI